MCILREIRTTIKYFIITFKNGASLPLLLMLETTLAHFTRPQGTLSSFLQFSFHLSCTLWTFTVTSMYVHTLSRHAVARGIIPQLPTRLLSCWFSRYLEELKDLWGDEIKLRPHFKVACDQFRMDMDDVVVSKIFQYSHCYHAPLKTKYFQKMLFFIMKTYLPKYSRWRHWYIRYNHDNKSSIEGTHVIRGM